MCGLTGFLHPEPSHPVQRAETVTQRMTAALTHRGPDSDGFWAEDGAGLALGHRRLSILDLSPAGHQPMHSACGRFVIVFNGEIYNHTEIRKELSSAARSIAWRGHSDTETLLAAIVHYGIESALKRCVGMFALALWDRQQRSLTLARDRFGEKPLYYGFAQGRDSVQLKSGAQVVNGSGPLLFGSELKALMAHPAWQGTLAEGVVEEYLRFGCVGGSHSIFQGVAKLPPGCLLTLTMDDVKAERLPAPTAWWSVDEAASAAKAGSPLDTPAAAIDELERTLSHSVKERMLADVPLGAFLSGGVDSSLIVALMQQQASRPVRTFSVGFDDSRYDEAIHAEAVAAHLGTEHVTLHATSQMALDLVPRLPEMYDEPFADASQVPTALLSQLVREHVTVALSGDSGDELFGGYNRHLWVPRIWRKIRRLPPTARRALAGALKTMPSGGYDRLMHWGGRLLPGKLQLRTFGEKVYKLAAVLESPNERALFAGVASMNHEAQALLVDDGKPPMSDSLFPALARFNGVEWMLLMDTLRFMVDDVLVKVDRASMASSLEVRVPFLDPDVFHTAWRMPAELRLHEGQGKWILRQLLYRHVPKELIERPKMGFAVPLDTWLRGPLREWASDLLSAQNLNSLPMLDAGAVQRMWQAHLKGQGHHAQQLWVVLQLVSWHQRWNNQRLT